MQYTTAFDASQNPFRNSTLLIPCIIFLFLSYTFVKNPEYAKVFRVKNDSKIFYIAVLLSVIYFIFSVWSIIGGNIAAGNYLQKGECSIVEGLVANFKPMPYGGHSSESFTVNGIRFSYSDFNITSGFNNTASHGGPIKPGLYVRICERGGEILRLEIAKD